MLVNKINNNQQNVNFKARVEIKFDNEFIAKLKTLAPEHCATLTDELIRATQTAKVIAPKVGNENDLITISSDIFDSKGQALGIKYNGKYQGLYNLQKDESPFDIIEKAFKKICQNFPSQKNEKIPEFSEAISDMGSNYETIEGSKEYVRKIDITNAWPPEHSQPKIIKIGDELNRLKQLETVA